MFGTPFFAFIIYVAVKEDTFCVRKSRKEMENQNLPSDLVCHLPLKGKAIKGSLFRGELSKSKILTEGAVAIN